MRGLVLDVKVSLVGRAAQVPMYLESYQVGRSQLFGAQGHSGDANFPNIIRLAAAGRLDLSPIITARCNLEQVVDAIAQSGPRAEGESMAYPNEAIGVFPGSKEFLRIYGSRENSWKGGDSAFYNILRPVSR